MTQTFSERKKFSSQVLEIVMDMNFLSESAGSHDEVKGMN